METPKNRSGVWAGILAEELQKAGLTDLCAAPGSRSTPLILAFNRQPGTRLWTHLDERSMGFFALGMAKALRKPVALLCTSGTAAANFYPAVAEAYAARIPLLVLTADRPPELVGWGAPQTMNQAGLYGSFVKESVNLPKPDLSDESIRYLRATACRALSAAGAIPAGPVHLNIPLVEPLTPGGGLSSSPAWAGPGLYRGGRHSERAYVKTPHAVPRIDDEALRDLADDLLKEERGLIVAGPMESADTAAGITLLARRLGYPVLADPLSQLRCGPHDKSLIIDSYDFLLREETAGSVLKPGVILRFGALPSSKPLHLFLQQQNSARQILIDPGGWRDPHHLLWDLIAADETVFCRQLNDRLPDTRRSSEWAGEWLDLASRVRGVVDQRASSAPGLFEGRLFHELHRLLSDGSTLLAGNSMPIRDLDGFFPKCDREILLMGNRGLNGIDGVVSTALGIAAADPVRPAGPADPTNSSALTGAADSPGPVVAVLGDISFYHDLNGLLAAKRHNLKVVFIVLNNNGGGIFSFLPQAGDPKTLDPLFAMPHGMTFKDAAGLYGLNYLRLESWAAFETVLLEDLRSTRSSLIEVPGDRELNKSWHEEIWQEGTAAAADYLSASPRGGTA